MIPVTAGAVVHAADCDIWAVPEEAQPEALFAEGITDEAIAVYCGEARPLYDAFKRVLGQLSGILILLQTGAAERDRHAALLDAARGQLAEARRRLPALRPPAGAARHAEALAEVGAALDRVAERMTRRLDLIDPASADLDGVVRALFDVHRRLLAAAEPRAGMAPVDFRHACCSCGAPAAPRPD